jgi:hypothetical protein
MSAGDLTHAELLYTVECRMFCGQRADVWQIGRFTRAICQTCGANHEAREAPADAPPATIPGVNAPHFVTGMSIAHQPAAEQPAPPAQALTPFTDQQEGQ